MQFSLEVQHIDQTCSFKLSWGQQLRLTAKVPYPKDLINRYETWRDDYLKFYHFGFRARVEQSGAGTLPKVDWRSRLVQAEAALLSDFHLWLNSAQLVQIRAAIAKAAADRESSEPVEVLITCDPIHLERLPWEAWELGTEFASHRPIRFARSPVNIRAEIISRKRRGKLRILAILGDDTGLDFKADKEAVESLSEIAEIEFVGWQWGQEQLDLKAQICRAIADDQGWDILFFAGHSNEAKLVGGELAIAPEESIFIHEIVPHLKIAQQNGLQFAIFNSCSGLNIANSLIELGLGQVAMMREPINNQVAQEFLIRFVNQFKNYVDVHDALISACQSLKSEKNITYPSAYLVPSLFRHAGTTPFKPEPFGWRQWLKQLLRTRRVETITLATLTVLSVLPPVQGLLLEFRMGTQAWYRNVTQQIPATQSPPVLLVSIDDESLRQAKVDARKINYIDRTYIARLLDKAVDLQARVIGIDYVFSNPIRDDDPVLQRSVQQAIAQNAWIVFGSQERNGQELNQVSSTIAQPGQVLNGYITTTPGYLELLDQGRFCRDACPFAYLLALAQSLKESQTNLPQPGTQQDFRLQVIQLLAQAPATNPTTQSIHDARLLPLTSLSNWASQGWLHPLLDFSIPPAKAYQRIPAHQFLDASFSRSKLPIPQGSPSLPPIVMIAPGGYSDAGVNQPGEDNHPIPLAISYWRSQKPEPHPLRVFTGAEFHAYAIHHLLQRHRLIPIPDLWMLGVALILAKGTIFVLKMQQRTTIRRGWFILAIILYGVASLQVYVMGVLVPWLLPSILFWVFVQPVVRKQLDAS